jgi:hypothetical protein
MTDRLEETGSFFGATGAPTILVTINDLLERLELELELELERLLLELDRLL